MCIDCAAQPNRAMANQSRQRHPRIGAVVAKAPESRTDRTRCRLVQSRDFLDFQDLIRHSRFLLITSGYAELLGASLPKN